jgi:hypothetical protein
MSASVSSSRSYPRLNDHQDVAELDGPAPTITAVIIATGLVLVLSLFAQQIWTLLEIALRILMSTR